MTRNKSTLIARDAKAASRRRAYAGTALAAAVLLSGCVPIPGSTINACVGCVHSTASTTMHAPADAGESAPVELDAGALPPLPGITPAPIPDASGMETPAPATEAGDAVASPHGAIDPQFAERLRTAEGLCDMPCGDPPHIGYGHQLPMDGGSADALLEYDMAEAAAGAERVAGEELWAVLSEPRRQVLTEIALMTGATGLSRFELMLEALRAKDYGRAAEEIVDSTLEPPDRVARLAQTMREG